LPFALHGKAAGVYQERSTSFAPPADCGTSIVIATGQQDYLPKNPLSTVAMVLYEGNEYILPNQNLGEVTFQEQVRLDFPAFD
jgi:hypothetical protein